MLAVVVHELPREPDAWWAVAMYYAIVIGLPIAGIVLLFVETVSASKCWEKTQMAIDPFLTTEFEPDFFVVPREAESSFVLPGHMDECRVVSDAECNVLGYIREDVVDVFVKVLNRAWDDASKRREILYKMASVAVDAGVDSCDEWDLVEKFEEIVAGRM